MSPDRKVAPTPPNVFRQARESWITQNRPNVDPRMKSFITNALSIREQLDDPQTDQVNLHDRKVSRGQAQIHLFEMCTRIARETDTTTAVLIFNSITSNESGEFVIQRPPTPDSDTISSPSIRIVESAIAAFSQDIEKRRKPQKPRTPQGSKLRYTIRETITDAEQDL